MSDEEKASFDTYVGYHFQPST